MPKSPRFLPKTIDQTRSRLIEILVYPSVQLLDVAGPLQVFASANEHVLRSGGHAPYALRTVAMEGRVASSAGLELVAMPLPDVKSPVDTLVVAGGSGVMVACDDPILTGWLSARAMVARRTASVCTGAFLLASCGMLDGRRVTTHWSFCAELAERYPAALVEPDPIFLNDGPIWTSAGVTAGIDLA
ncbi:MAG: AraC family transcriptional regulator, partial [Alphaproteobacteria bacterium]